MTAPKSATAKKTAAKKTMAAKPKTTSVAEVKKEQQEADQRISDSEIVAKARLEVERDREGKKDNDPVAAQKQAEKNDEEFDPNVIHNVHDEVENKLLNHASTNEARLNAEKNYLLQQERQAQLERDTQKGLGFNGVRDDKDKSKDVLAS